jgi:hypothetical protein
VAGLVVAASGWLAVASSRSMWASVVPMARTRTGRQDTMVVMAHGARAWPAWTSRWYATCPAMPKRKEQIADRFANLRVRGLIQRSVASQARSA